MFYIVSSGRKVRRAFTDNEWLPSLAKVYFLFDITPTKIHLKIIKKRNIVSTWQGDQKNDII